MIAKPSRAQLLSMRPGRDGAVVFPPRSKPDQWGETHCPFPVRLTYETTELNPAAALRDLELNIGEQVTDRDSHPLFGDAAGQTYTHHYLHNLLKLVLAHLYGASVAALYTWHSFRSGLATALHAANVPDAMIMLICRWMCPESLHVYRRMGTREHERLINEASAINVDAIQSANVVRVVGDQGYAALFSDLQLNQSAHSRDFARTTNTALDARSRQLTPAEPISPTAPPPLRQPLRAQPQQPTYVGPPARLQQLPSTVRPGDAVVVPASLWPAYSCKELGGAGWTATIRRVHRSTARVSFDVAQTRDGRPYTKTSCCHSTISEWQSSNRPDFPPASPCGNREFWADVPHRNRDHRAYGAVRRVHSFYLSLQRHGRKKVGSLRSAICLLAADV